MAREMQYGYNRARCEKTIKDSVNVSFNLAVGGASECDPGDCTAGAAARVPYDVRWKGGSNAI